MTSDDDEIGPYPLAWPVGRPRTKVRQRSMFNSSGNRLTVAQGRDRVLDELERLKGRDVVISSDYSGLSRAEPKDPGAAVYFRLANGQGNGLHCLAVDKWDRLADNLAAIAAHVEAVRGQLRWGVGDIAQAFAGFRALSAVGAVRPWWELLGISPQATAEQIKARFRNLATLHHPDRGGNTNQMAEISAAYQEAMRARGAAP